MARPEPSDQPTQEPAHESPGCAAGVPFLRDLPTPVLADLGRQMRHREIERGAVVALAGDPIDHLIVVASGRLQTVRATAHGREQVTRALEPGDFLGELALFTPARHEGDVVAMEPSTICVLARDAVQSLLAEHPSVAAGLVEALARRLTEAERTIAELALQDVEARLASAILRFVPAGTPAENAVRVQVPVTWVELAARLGTTPESLSRRLDALTRRGLIAREAHRRLAIRDVSALKRLAES